MDANQIQAILTKRQRDLRNIKAQKAYYDGQHPAILADGPKDDPDNRIPVPIVRKAVNLVMGYMFRPGDIVYAGDYYENRLKPIYDANEESILTSELASSCLKHGRAYELHWFDGSEPRVAQVPPEQAIPLWSDDIVPQMIGFIRHYKVDDIERIDYYDRFTVQQWSKPKDQWISGDTSQHGYNAVPIVEYTVDGGKANLYDHVLSLVDLLDQSISEDVANELQRYANAYLLLADRIDNTARDEYGETELDKIKRTRVFQGLAEDVRTKIGFLTKSIDPTFVNTALDRIERLIYDMLSVPNPADNVFAAQTGIALEYKLQPFEYLCSTMQIYFTRGLQQRIRLIANLDTAIGTGGVESEVSISFHRNKPSDVASIADTMVKLASFLSDETLLKMLPSSVVPDVEEELARIGEAVTDFENVPPVEPEDDTGA